MLAALRVAFALGLAACGSVAGGDPPVDGAPPADAEIRADGGPCPMDGNQGTVSATWDLSRDGRDVSCADIGAVEVELVTKPTCVGGEEIGDLFDCGDLSGMTQQVDEGPFEVFLVALDGNRDELGQSVSVFIEVDTNRDTDVGNLTIVIPP